MAHQISFDIRGKAQMAYINDVPWHSLGQQLTAGATIETWSREAGMDFQIVATPVRYDLPEGKTSTRFTDAQSLSTQGTHDSMKVLLRNDSNAVLGVVGNKYKVVQPIEVLEFFRNLTEEYHFELETAGVLFNGAKYWALANTGKAARIGKKGSKDEVRGYLLLTTSCDGTLQTTAQFTSVRVVCNNTLTASLLNPKDKIGAIKVSHRSTFKAEDVQSKLGIDTGWTRFVDAANELAKIHVTSEQASKFLVKLLQDANDRTKNMDADKVLASKEAQVMLQLFDGKGRGADMASSKGTAWGLVNAVTEAVDHLRGVSQDARLYQAWYHAGNVIKRAAFDEAAVAFA